MDKLIGTTIGGCLIEEKIGQGGMGTVYRAHHGALDIPVAFKILKTLTDVPDAKERFLREARIAARLKHPNIVGVLNVGYENGIHFIIMDHIDGNNLQDLITKHGKIPAEGAVRIAVHILHALDMALKNGIVHRDIKPENILIDKSGTAKLADLGLARISGDMKLTMPNVMLGSPHYIAPEQAENPSDADSRSDIYALGCTLYHMLAGVTPFPGTSVVDVLVKHMNRPVPNLKNNEPTIPKELSDIIYKMMQKEKSKRYQTPEEVILAFNNIYPQDGNGTGAGIKLSNGSFFKKAVVITSTVFLIFAAVAAYFLIKKSYRPLSTTVEVVSAIVRDSIKDSVPAVPAKIPNSKKLPVIKKSTNQNIPLATVTTNPVAKQHPLLSVVKIGDTQELKRLLKDGISPKCEAGALTSPLHEAVRRGLTVETQLLLENGADPNFRDASGDTPLHYALSENASYLATILLNGGADPNLVDHKGVRPLRTAEMIDSDLEKLLRKYGAR